MRVHRFLTRLSGNAADADDLLQETFLIAWKHRGAFEARGSAAGWVLKTAFRTYLNAQRRRVRRNGMATGAAAGAPFFSAPASVERSGRHDEAGAVERRDALSFVLSRVKAAVAELPDGPREAFIMYRMEGLSVAEIAGIVDAPLKTVETRIRRAAQLLAERLGALRQHLPTS